MSEYAKNVKVLEGPWEKSAFPNGVETTDVISRTISTRYIQDGYLCEEIVQREYRGEDYLDTTSSKRIIKLDN
tara:strand:+ start:13658 stop:13876 length:219 start_codon:yes stop_codon:yes gene_type:complete